MKKKVFALLALFSILCLSAFSLALLHKAGIRVNRSASLPGLLYRVRLLEEGAPIERGDVVLIDLSKVSNSVIDRGVARGYVNLREPMLKRVAALPGDTVALRGGFLFVNQDAIKMTVASRDSGGGKLSAWPTPLVLSPDRYWLASDPIRGFDSRYFGPVCRKALTHKATPLIP